MRLRSRRSRQLGVFSFEGRMVDGPILRHAECVVARAGLRAGWRAVVPKVGPNPDARLKVVP
ncbi:Hydroxymethylglutaryl-CoA lyase [Leifsonia rubra CMS 76R]|nr:Hydroxymethylglutaryl-CoA lyase [Leifsonia rubra CMS 76R]